MNRNWRTVVVALSAVLGALFLTGAATAAPSGDAGIMATGRSNIPNNPYLAGSGTFTWGTTTLRGAMSVDDKVCDPYAVAIYIAVFDKDGDEHHGTVRWNTNCGGGYMLFDNLTWNNGNERIAGFEIHGVQGTPVWNVYEGNYVDNPLT